MNSCLCSRMYCRRRARQTGTDNPRVCRSNSVTRCARSRDSRGTAVRLSWRRRATRSFMLTSHRRFNAGVRERAPDVLHGFRRRRLEFGQLVRPTKPPVFVRPDAVIGQQVDIAKPEPMHHRNHQTNVLAAVVDPRYHGKSYDDVGMGRRQRCEILQDEFVAKACRFSVPRLVHELDVVQKQVDLVRHPQQFPLVSHPAGLDRSRYAFVLTGLKQTSQECLLHEGFATREGDTAARFLEENAVPNELVHNLCHRHDPARNRPGSGETGVDTLSTCGTRVSGPRYSTLQDCRMRRAYCQAIPTSGTPFHCDHKFGAGALAFGVMAPLASQRTALEAVSYTHLTLPTIYSV